MSQEGILSEYDLHSTAFEEVIKETVARVEGLLGQGRIQNHSVSGRIKNRESLRAKIARPDKTYHALWEVTDLVGLRITTYFEDTVELVKELIERNFAVDFGLSVDRRHSKTFGYRSLHYVCAWNGGGLPKEFRFEIQVRTILQHAWAEIEHDLGYKASDSIPESVRRRFSRVAGLLEIADEEFVSIRKDLKSYSASIQGAILDPKHSFPLDRVSLEFCASAPDVQAVDTQIATILVRPLGEDVFSPEYLLKTLKLAGYSNTHGMRSDLAKYREQLLGMISPYFEFARKAWKLSASDLESVPAGYCLFFLSHIAVMQSSILDLNKVTKLAQFYRELDYPDDESAAYQVASGLVDALKW